MSRNKKTAAESTSFRNGQQMQLDLGASAPLTVNYTPQPGTIASVLLVGESNALTAAEISRVTGLPIRAVTKRIMHERRQGAPILSSPESGYWIASDAAEVLSCVTALHSRAKSIHATAEALKRIVSG